jgi:hypothetical protein
MNIRDQHLLKDRGSDVFLKDPASQHRASGCTNPCPEKENEETIIVPVKKSRKKVVAEKKEPDAAEIAEKKEPDVVAADANGAELVHAAEEELVHQKQNV